MVVLQKGLMKLVTGILILNSIAQGNIAVPDNLLPPYLNYKEQGLTTPSDNQYQSPTCWKYAAIAMYESKLLIKKWGSWDLDEDPINVSIDVFKYFYTNKPKLETTSETLDFCPYAVSQSILYSNWDFIGYYLPATQDESGIKEIKKSLYLDGPGSVSIDMFEGLYLILNVYQVTHNVWVQSTPNERVLGPHMVTIIGWDDGKSYVKNGSTYFGAWLVKNSYGNKGPNGDGTFWLAFSNHTQNPLTYGTGGGLIGYGFYNATLKGGNLLFAEGDNSLYLDVGV